MVQTFQVLRCFKCSVFQVHQTKKSNKWKCKLCYEKQSIKRHYGLGTGKECRLHVQKLNSISGYLNETNHNSASEDSLSPKSSPNTVCKTSTDSGISKWQEYVDTSAEILPEHLSEELNKSDKEIDTVLKVPKKKFKQQIHHVHDKYNNIVNITENCNSELTSHLQNGDEKTFDKFTTEMSDKLEINTSTNSNISKCVLPPISKKSKWTHYIEQTEENMDNIEQTLKIENSQITQNLFSLFDDNELDTVLDF